MPPFFPVLGTENQSPYTVESRREIVALLKGLKESNQLITMLIKGGSEVYITSILQVDQDHSTVIIDSAPDKDANERIAKASPIYFEGLLDKISIQFSSSHVEPIQFENRPALKISLPRSLIRLQRREYYRINTPVTNPIRCSIVLEEESGFRSHEFSLVDISCGGVALLDEKRVLDTTIGTEYSTCRIDFPSIGLIDVALQVRNSQDLTLLNGKTNRRLGLQFLNLSNSVLASIQRYIMKLERERNSKF